MQDVPHCTHHSLRHAAGWRSLRTAVDALKPIIMEEVRRHPRLARSQIWENIMQEHFMRFLQSDFRTAIASLVDSGQLYSPTPRKTAKLNDRCTFVAADPNERSIKHRVD